MTGVAELRSAVPAGQVSADEAVAHTLLNCYLREVAEPERQALLDAGELRIRLPRQDILLSVGVRRAAMSGAHRFTGGVRVLRGAERVPLDWRGLAEYIAEELRRTTGVTNAEFVAQVAGSHAVTRALLLHPRPGVAADGRYLESERALLLGHRFHPTPKSRSGDRWQVHAPETGAWLAPRLLAVRTDLVRQREVRSGDLSTVDQLGAAPDGYTVLPVHPWQYELVRGNARLDTALRTGEIIDLGPAETTFAATSSVRTLYRPDGFLKFSLNVRITNCVRKNAAYELAGSVALTELLDTELAGWRTRYPDCALLREPAYRTVDLGDRDLLEAFGVIVREGPGRYARPGVTPLLAGAIADEYRFSSAQVGNLLGEPDTDRVLDWWRAYLRVLLPPVLGAFFAHGVVFEPHLQNVLIGVTDDGMPARALLRDLEGTKLIAGRHAGFLRGLDPAVAGPLTYHATQGWRRVAYCLLVNHVPETLAVLADLRPDLEPDLWGAVRDELAGCAAEHGRPAELRAVLAGVPLPAKANLLTRWRRTGDRDAGYLPVVLPLGLLA